MTKPEAGAWLPNTTQKYTFNQTAPECPYCGYVHRHDGGFFYEEDLTSFECERCDQTFDVEVYTSTSWTCTARPLPPPPGEPT